MWRAGRARSATRGGLERAPSALEPARRAPGRGPARRRSRDHAELAGGAASSPSAASIARAALRREESRGGHFRADFPARDDLHWKRRVADRARSGQSPIIGRAEDHAMSRDEPEIADEKQDAARHRDHAPVRGLLALVPRRRPPRRAGRLLAGQGLHGHPAVRLRHLGADPAGARPPLQGDRPRQRVLPAVHPREPADDGGRARRGLRAAGRVGHAAAATRSSRSGSSSARRPKPSSARCTRSGSSRGAICPSSSTSGPTSSAGRR